MTAEKSFPAKILLFGEYTLLIGSSALSIPYSGFQASLILPVKEIHKRSARSIGSNRQLSSFYKYLMGKEQYFSRILDLNRFRQELEEGLFFSSTIPAGYGLGSSGALVAAVFDRFLHDRNILNEMNLPHRMTELKSILSEMESFFHGKSSGFDPLVSLMNRPLFLRPDGIPEFATLPAVFSESGACIFLVDTGQTGKTAPLVKYFLEKFKPTGSVSRKGASLAELVTNLTETFLNYSGNRFWELLKMLSEQQLGDFHPMIPSEYIPLWQKGLENGLFYLKLCGSGGGGYLTGFGPDLNKAVEFLRESGYSQLMISDFRVS
jgi:mevalonate kinase